jgi:phosphoribosylformylglycinamidine cyclo-ligase
VLLERSARRLDEPAWPGAAHSLADELLRPSVIYSPAMQRLRAAVPVHGFAHVTGGGLAGNLVRVLPRGVDAVIREGTWSEPPIFDEIRRSGDVATQEMARTFNLGVGMVAVVPPEAVPGALAVLAEALATTPGAEGEVAVIGEVVAGSGVVRLVPSG